MGLSSFGLDVWSQSAAGSAGSKAPISSNAGKAPILSTPQIPTVEQLNAARFLRWHQALPISSQSSDSESSDDPPIEHATSALLTQDALRSFVQSAGLVLFAPRPQMVGVPAPTVIEATLGRSISAPSLTDAVEARTLIARLIADGSVVALNLLGAPTTTAENPDFIAASSVFPYIFTLRGDKLWKQPPANSGATKVSPLAINTFTFLVEHGPRTAADLALELGKGLTEAAVLRALNELWQHLRVLPVPQADSAPAIWETAAARFTKQIKAGANAGQPSALSALISLYLGQVVLATEDEIETFLSPLAPRSRVRDVLHALSAGQQLESLVIEGKHCVHLTGDLPRFAEPGAVAADQGAPVTGEAQVELAEDGSRIKKFQPHKTGTGFVSRPKPFATKARPDRERRPFERSAGRLEGSARGPAASDSRAPARLPSSGRSDRKAATSGSSFVRPWDEERANRTGNGAQGSRPAGQTANTPERPELDLDATATLRSSRPARPYTPRTSTVGRPAFGERARKTGGERPAYGRRTRTSGVGPRDGTRSASASQSRFGSADSRPSRSGSDDFEGATSRSAGRTNSRSTAANDGADTRRADTGYRRSDRGDRPDTRGSRPGQRDGAQGHASRSGRETAGGARRPPASGKGPREGGFARPRAEGTHSFGEAKQRPAYGGPGREAGDSENRQPFRRFDAPRGPKRPFNPERSSTGQRREAPAWKGGDRPKSSPVRGPRTPAAAGDRSTGTRSERPSRAGSFDRPRAGAAGPDRERGRKPGGDRPVKSFRGPFRAETAAAGASTFDKFKGGNKPWGKRPPARKIKPAKEES